MMNIISSEIYKIFKSKVFYGVLTIFLFMNSISFISGVMGKLYSTSSETGISAFQQSYTADGIIYIILIFVAFLVTAEYSNGSIRQMACRGIERWKLLIGQYMAISLVTTIVICGFGFVNLLLFTLLYKLGDIDIIKFLYTNLGIICIVWASTALSIFLSYALKNVGVTIIATIFLAKGSDLMFNVLAALTNNDILKNYGFTNMRKIIIDFSSTPQEIMACCGVSILIGLSMICGACLLFSKRDID